MKIYPHINFGGECEAAFHFYEQCLGGKIGTMLTWGNSPMAKDTPPEWHSKICHASLTAGESELAGVDDPFEVYEPPKGFQIVLEIKQSGDSERIFQALAEKGISPLANAEDFLGSPLWCASGPIRGSLGDQLRTRGLVPRCSKLNWPLRSRAYR